MIRYTLPYPPSVNNLFANGKSGRYRTDAYKQWGTQAGWEIIRQGKKQLRGPVSVAIAVVKPDRRKRDLDNLQKPILDLLVMMEIIEDDSLVQRLSIQWVAGGEPCTVLVQQAEEAVAA